MKIVPKFLVFSNQWKNINFEDLQETLLYACETAISQSAATVKTRSPASENHLEKSLENTTEKHQKCQAPKGYTTT